MNNDRSSGKTSRGSLPLGRYAFFLCLGVLLLGAGACHASDEWKTEFEAVCSKTDLLSEMPEPEITSLLERCDKLATTLDTENESFKKVYLRRLKNCRDLIQFMLDSKKAGTQTEEKK
jgi:hypothetical protein